MTGKLKPKTQINLKIEHIAGLGDGVGHYENQTVFTALTAPGDEALVEIETSQKDFAKAKLIKILKKGETRIEPKCKYFGKCGGCSLQHINEKTYYGFKENIIKKVSEKLKAKNSAIKEIIKIGDHSRRRAEFKVSVYKGEVSLGFFAAKSHDVIDIDACPVTDEKIAFLLPKLKQTLSQLKNPGIINSLHFTATDTGLDLIVNLKNSLTNTDNKKIIEFAQNNKVIRLSEKIENEKGINCLYGNYDAKINFSDIEVTLPIGAFLQATEKGQKEITKIILDNLDEAKNIADFYSGCGTYSLALHKEKRKVTAFEGDSAMNLAMHNALLKANLDQNISSNMRDLYLNPVTKKELEDFKFDAAIINPPRNGAKPQIEELAKSDIKKIIMVSCNPATFTRDASLLQESGFKTISITAIDQFYWNGHLEIAAVFKK